MARSKKAKSTQELTQSVNDATSAATANMLRLAARAGGETGHAETAETIARLSRMCEEAADHMAQAQTMLFDGHDGGEAAINHLDAALQCLNNVANESEQHIVKATAKARSA